MNIVLRLALCVIPGLTGNLYKDNNKYRDFRPSMTI